MHQPRPGGPGRCRAASSRSARPPSPEGRISRSPPQPPTACCSACSTAAGTETRMPMLDFDAGVWHAFVPGVGPGQAYGYRATGPYDPARGIRCNPAKLLLDPYARALRGTVTPGPDLLGYADPGSDEPSTADSACQRAAQPGHQRGIRLDGRGPAGLPLPGHDHLRDARQGLHHAPPRDTGGAARDLRRAGPRRGPRPSARPRGDQRRTAPGARERARAVPGAARPDQLLGLQHDRLLRAAPGLLGRGAGRAARAAR